VQAYRLIGYENRILKSEDFNNDKRDAGELGSGHTVTALYEIIPAGVESEFFHVDDLKYQKNSTAPFELSGDLLTLKLRYKDPDVDVSRLIVHTLSKDQPIRQTSDNFKWSAAVAAFGMLLRDSEYVNNYSYEDLIMLAQSAKGDDPEGYRSEFISMARSFGLIASR
jgi:Ca-activated chloride channel family protein